MRNRCLQLDAVAVHGSRRNITQADGLARVLAFLGADFLTVEADLCRIAAEQLCAQRADFAAQLVGALLGGLAGDVDRARGIRARVIRRPVGVRAEHGNVLQRALEHLCRNLCKRGVAACAHIRRADEQRVEALIVDLEGRTANVHARDARALHRHAHADRAHLAVSHVAARILVIPVDHVVYARQTAVERAARVQLTVIRGHDLALMRDIHFADPERVHTQLVRQLVHRTLDREQALCCAVAAVRARRHMVGIHNIAREAERLCLAVQRDGLVAGQADGRRAVLAVSAGVGQGVHVDGLENAVVVTADLHMHLHLMAGRGSDLGLIAGVNDLGRFAGEPGDHGRVNFHHSGLLGAEAAADSGLHYADFGLGNVQGVGQNPADVEHDLGGGDHVQTAVYVHVGKGPESLHHSLLIGLGVVNPVDHVAALCHHRVHVALLL